MHELHSVIDLWTIVNALRCVKVGGSPLMTNTEARQVLQKFLSPDERNLVACPRCASRGRERWVNVEDMQVCHIPFLKVVKGYRDRSPLALLALGCVTCNSEDPDFGVSHAEQRAMLSEPEDNGADDIFSQID